MNSKFLTLRVRNLLRSQWLKSPRQYSLMPASCSQSGLLLLPASHWRALLFYGWFSGKKAEWGNGKHTHLCSGLSSGFAPEWSSYVTSFSWASVSLCIKWMTRVTDLKELFWHTCAWHLHLLCLVLGHFLSLVQLTWPLAWRMCTDLFSPRLLNPWLLILRFCWSPAPSPKRMHLTDSCFPASPPGGTVLVSVTCALPVAQVALTCASFSWHSPAAGHLPFPKPLIPILSTVYTNVPSQSFLSLINMYDQFCGILWRG